MTLKNIPGASLPHFGIVLVNYKTPKLTTACLQLLKKALIGYDAEVWVVDNDSADASLDYLRGLDWIHLIERKAAAKERGFEAHGAALDMVLGQIPADYLFVLHTDTLIHDATVFSEMLQTCMKTKSTYLVGCLEQINRGWLRSGWRFTTRWLQFHLRKAKLAMGMHSKKPSPYRETQVKSFCALWNVKILRQYGLNFLAAGRTPGYEAQDLLSTAGYQRVLWSASKMFHYLDHVESGTVSANNGYAKAHRRTRRYQTMLS